MLKLFLQSFFIYYFLIGLTACNLSGSQKISSSFSIKGDIKELEESKVYLSIKLRNSSKYQIIDSTLSFNGKFKLSGSLDEPHFAIIHLKSLSTDQKDLYITGWIENGKMKIISNATSRNIKIRGSKTNDLFLKYSSFWQPGYTKEIANKINNGNNQNNGTEKYSIYEHKQQRYFESLSTIIDNMNPSFYMLWGIYNARPYLSYYQMSKLLERLNFNISDFPTGKELIEYMKFYKQLQTGLYAPAFKAIDTSGNRFSLNVIKGKFVLMDFWASWCRPCREEFPELKRVYQKYHGKGLEILGIAIKDSTPFWKKAITSDSIAWPNVLEAKDTNVQVTDIYCLTHIPQNILLSPQRKIIAKNVPINQMDSILHKYFLDNQ